MNEERIAISRIIVTILLVALIVGVSILGLYVYTQSAGNPSSSSSSFSPNATHSISSTQNSVSSFSLFSSSISFSKSSTNEITAYTSSSFMSSSSSPTSSSSSHITTQSTTSTLSSTLHSLQKGITITPTNFTSAGITDFFQRASALGSTVSWAGDWQELGSNNGAPAQIIQLAQAHNLTAVIESQFFTQSSGALLRPLDNNTIANYTRIAASFAKQFHPKYMGFGIEVNILYEKSSSTFDSFVSLYNKTYSAVKSASPDTHVFTIFQLERMAGMQGGLYGGNNNATSEWSLLSRFRMDAVGFTTYPDLIFKQPSYIPQGFYSQIENHTSLPIIFTEIGWHTAPAPTGWESSQQEQALFVSTFFNLTKGINQILVIWSFLYDQQGAPVPFDSMGLVNSDGTARPALVNWKNA